MNKQYMEYVDQVLAILDNTKVPDILNMAHTLTGTSNEVHARILNRTIMQSYVTSMTPQQAADVIERSVTAAFVKLFTAGKTVN